MFVCPGHGNAVFLPDLPTVYRTWRSPEMHDTALPFPYLEGI
ncbi:hypothetical protein [Microcoleus sp. bin38.metabat.b11b12b14.051]|nr:hypothetical protein [Microcoleus sp. bin38.metabat.b11b12b14.051]